MMAAHSASARVPASGDGHPSAAPRAEASVQPYLAQQVQQAQLVPQVQQARHAYRPAAPSSGEYDEASEYSASASSVSTFTQFLRDYTLRLDPVICAKMRKRCADRMCPSDVRGVVRAEPPQQLLAAGVVHAFGTNHTPPAVGAPQVSCGHQPDTSESITQ